jgi:hypothetical protein
MTGKERGGRKEKPRRISKTRARRKGSRERPKEQARKSGCKEEKKNTPSKSMVAPSEGLGEQEAVTEISRNPGLRMKGASDHFTRLPLMKNEAP